MSRLPLRLVPHPLAWLLAVALPAQGNSERTVSLTVVGVAERSVYLDHGRDLGLAVGTMVRLFPPGTAGVDAEVRAVSGNGARAELPPGVPVPPVGTRAEARVRVEAETPPAPAAGHPPWQRREAPRGPDQPLLVPAYGQRPDQRPATLDGRLFLLEQYSQDRGAGRDASYLLSRLGLRADATNWFGRGERVRLATEADDRRALLSDAPDQDDQNGRLDQLSVAFGTEAWAATGLEAGRFFVGGLPELGLVDGLELVRRYQGGLRFGGGFGAFPRPFPIRDTGDDVGVFAYADFTSDAQRTFAAAAGVQKTWHRGAPDRDLLLLRVEARPTARTALFATAKVDYYSAGDTVKGSGVELTEAFGSARYDGDGFGTALSASYFTWPELLRREYQNLPIELVRDGHVERGSWSGYSTPWAWLRWSVRADAWADQDRSGTAWGCDADLRDVTGLGSGLLLSWYMADGGVVGGPTGRVLWRFAAGPAALRLGGRWQRYEVRGLAGGDEEFDRQSLECGCNLPIGHHGDVDLALEHWWGDREDTWIGSMYLQWRF